MAKVTMDISEMKLMEEKAKLLKESLKREKELSDKLEKATRERIEALKSNEKIVTIVRRKTVATTLKTRMPAEDIRRTLNVRINQIVRRVISEGQKSAHENEKYHGNFLNDTDMFGTRAYGEREVLRYITRDMDNLIEHISRQYDLRPEELHGLFYQEDQIVTSDEPEQITRKGLDDVALEMKNEALDELSKKSREALSLNPILEKETREAKDELKLTQKSLKSVEQVSENKTKEIEELLGENSKIQGLIKENAVKLTAINLVVTPEITKFGNRKKLIEVKRILDENYE